MQPPVSSNHPLLLPDRNFDSYNVFLDGELVYQEFRDKRDPSWGIAARQRVTTVHQNIMSLCMEDSQLLKMKLPAQQELQLRSQIMTLPWECFLAFVHKAPFRQQMGLARATPENGPWSVLEASVSMPVSGTVSTLKTKSNDNIPNTPLKSSTSMKQPTNESESYQAANGSTKRKREDSAAAETPTNTSASNAKNARDARQSKLKYPSTARSPRAKTGMRWLYRKEELALEKAGLRLFHKDGMGEVVAEKDA